MNWSIKPNHPGWYWIFVVPTMFPSGSQWVLNIYIGYMSREREREREREITTYLIWDFPKLEFFLKKIVMGQSKMPITKEKQLNFRGPHN
jgi:hypothetical protein